MNNRRKGKIARLPREWKDVVNLMIQDGATYAQVIERLSAGGFKDINEQNLVAWYQGGYEDWLKEQERLDDLKERRELSIELVKQGDGAKIHEANLLLAASQMQEVISDFDIQSLKTLLIDKPENYMEVINALTKLSKGTVEVEKFKENVAEQKRKIAAEIGKAKTDGGITPETIAKIEEALKLL